MNRKLPGYSLPPLALAVAMALATSASAQTLIAVKAAQAPKLDALASDPAWAKAAETKVELKNGRNFAGGATTARLKAVYTPDTLYLLIRYADPTQSVRRSPYVKQADGSWTKLADPDDNGGDNNKYYEDKVALLWPIGNSIKGFAENGCFMLCHLGEGKPFGNKYTAAEGELGDIWHMKSVRTGYIGQTDNQYVDHTRYDKEKSPEAGRKSDPKTGGGYTDMKLVAGKPEFMNKDSKAANKGGTYWLREEDKVKHMVWSFWLTLAALLVMSAPLAFLAVFLLGLTKECWDARYGSGFCWFDMTGNLIGSVTGLLLGWAGLALFTVLR